MIIAEVGMRITVECQKDAGRNEDVKVNGLR